MVLEAAPEDFELVTEWKSRALCLRGRRACVGHDFVVWLMLEGMQPRLGASFARWIRLGGVVSTRRFLA